jgi:hypothetical protein
MIGRDHASLRAHPYSPQSGAPGGPVAMGWSGPIQPSSIAQIAFHWCVKLGNQNSTSERNFYNLWYCT